MLIKKIKKKELIDKSNISGIIDNSNLDEKTAKLATKSGLKAVQNKKIKTSIIWFQLFP